jgi:hypothetical protein
MLALLASGFGFGFGVLLTPSFLKKSIDPV